MPTPLETLIACGTKLWLDSVDPDLVRSNRAWGATGATSNPIIIADLIKTGRFDQQITKLLEEDRSDDEIAWALTDQLVREAQGVFLPVWEQTRGNDGYVSFELDPLLEDAEQGPPHRERVARYVELARQWAQGQRNRMIKIPATQAGLAALEEVAASGVTINVTLIFSERQYIAARDAIWRGVQRRKDGLSRFKSVYSIFISRLDVYTEKHVPELSDRAQGLVGIVNAKRIWQLNNRFWSDKKLPLQQEMIFASTGTKKPGQPADFYVEAMAGSDIMTNPPSTNEKVQALGKTYTRKVDQLPPAGVLAEIDAKVDMEQLEETLMREGVEKFSDPGKALLALIGEKRGSLSAAK